MTRDQRERLRDRAAWLRSRLKTANGEYAAELEVELHWIERQLQRD